MKTPTQINRLDQTLNVLRYVRAAESRSITKWIMLLELARSKNEDGTPKQMTAGEVEFQSGTMNQGPTLLAMEESGLIAGMKDGTMKVYSLTPCGEELAARIIVGSQPAGDGKTAVVNMAKVRAYVGANRVA